jgi:hypothetical protein
MPSPYVYERQSEYWTSRAVEDALLDAGFDCLAFPLTGRTEHLLPADFIFAGDTAVNVFGFQYKALYGDPRDGWQIDERQRKALESSRGSTMASLSLRRRGIIVSLCTHFGSLPRVR